MTNALMLKMIDLNNMIDSFILYINFNNSSDVY